MKAKMRLGYCFGTIQIRLKLFVQTLLQLTLIKIRDIRSGAQPLAKFGDCHSDDITQVRFHPTEASALITGSTDG